MNIEQGRGKNIHLIFNWNPYIPNFIFHFLVVVRNTSFIRDEFTTKLMGPSFLAPHFYRLLLRLEGIPTLCYMVIIFIRFEKL